MLGRILIGDASLKNISGPITMADYAGQSAQAGALVFVGYLALISISLGVLNLLPVPLLDGGHLLYYFAEIIKGSPVSDRAFEVGQRIGMAMLAVLMAWRFSMTSPACSESAGRMRRARRRSAASRRRVAARCSSRCWSRSARRRRRRAFEPFVVTDIRVEGVQRTEAGTVFCYLPVKVGERIDDEKVGAGGQGAVRDRLLPRRAPRGEGDVLVVIVAGAPDDQPDRLRRATRSSTPTR